MPLADEGYSLPPFLVFLSDLMSIMDAGSRKPRNDVKQWVLRGKWKEKVCSPSSLCTDRQLSRTLTGNL